ncbi:MAG TPA: hypothetical protein PKY81_12610 [bacterium]|nr:hypothetical protein [bacterium]
MNAITENYFDKKIESIILYGSTIYQSEINNNNEYSELTFQSVEKVIKQIILFLNENNHRVNDVDLMIIHSENFCLSKRVKQNGVLFDLYYIDFWHLFQQVVSGSAEDKIYSLANGAVLYDDTDGLLDLLIDFAKHKFNRGAGIYGEREKIFGNTGMQNLMLEAEKYLNSGETIDSLAVMNRLFVNIIDNYFKWNGVWDLPNKKRLNYIKDSDKNFYDKISEYLSEKKCKEKFIKLKRVYFDLIMPHSTFLQGSWEASNHKILQNEQIELIKFLQSKKTGGS